jgi:hypothetical protein
MRWNDRDDGVKAYWALNGLLIREQNDGQLESQDKNLLGNLGQ